VATLTVSREWQVSPPVVGEIFRVRHLGTLYGEGLICQSLLVGTEISTFDIRQMYANHEPEIYRFVSFWGMTERRLAVKSLVQDAVPWNIVIERYTATDNPSDHPVLYGDFSTALATKADAAAMTTALATKADAAAMTTALDTKADAAAMTTALATKADRSDLSALGMALATKADAAAVTTALATKADAAAMTTALATKADRSDLSALGMALATKADAAAVTTALAAKADAAAVTTALATKADAAAMTTALATKADAAAMTTALATKADAAAMTTALADKVSTAALTAALADKDGVITLTVQTTDNSLTEMVTPQRVILRANSTTGYEITLVGQRMNVSTPEFIYWLGSGAITRGATAADTNIPNATTSTRRSATTNGMQWNPTISADTVNGALKIQVKGSSGMTIKWVAKVKLTEVW
jgi:hypothetical protein